jgi:hypothetical protein
MRKKASRTWQLAEGRAAALFGCRRTVGSGSGDRPGRVCRRPWRPGAGSLGGDDSPGVRKAERRRGPRPRHCPMTSNRPRHGFPPRPGRDRGCLARPARPDQDCRPRADQYSPRNRPMTTTTIDCGRCLERIAAGRLVVRLETGPSGHEGPIDLCDR